MREQWPLPYKIVRLLLVYLVVNSVIDAYAFFYDIGVNSPGYDLAFDLLPRQAWGFLLAFATASALLALLGHGARRNDFARMAFVFRSIVDIFFGLAILHSTFIGETSAISGPGKWWRGPIIAIAVFMLPSPGQNTIQPSRENREANA